MAHPAPAVQAWVSCRDQAPWIVRSLLMIQAGIGAGLINIILCVGALGVLTVGFHPRDTEEWTLEQVQRDTLGQPMRAAPIR